MAEAPSTARDAAILADQVAYYRARAAEYDEWWFRKGRYDRGEALNALWRTDCDAAESAVERMLEERRPKNVLELACGTGNFTRHLAPATARLVAIDASPEVLGINRVRTAASNVEYVEADVFDWRSPERFDLVFFSFWLSHVPTERFAMFWAQVREQLAPGGSAYLVDSAFDQTSSAKDHVLSDSGIAMRRLNDGREFQIVKVFYDPQELNARLARLGWHATIAPTARYFIHGPASPAAA
jgi:demethylmenaquinone methyltransferase/2-methoxy-6-polyprenyl-1,4-benzoquinol methylase